MSRTIQRRRGVRLLRGVVPGLSKYIQSPLMVAACVLAFAAAIGLGLWEPWRSDGREAANTAPRFKQGEEPRTRTSDVLSLVSANASLGAIGHFWFVEGNVTNLSTESFDRVEAVAHWFDRAGAPVATDSAMIDAALLRPGANSTFTVMTPARSELAAFTIDFRDSQGQPLGARNTRRFSVESSGSP